MSKAIIISGLVLLLRCIYGVPGDLPTPSTLDSANSRQASPPVCPQTQSNVKEFAYPTTGAQLQGSILEYLNQGGQIDPLRSLLWKLRIDSEVRLAELNGDNYREVIVSIAVWTNNQQNYAYALWVFQCTPEGIYQVLPTLIEWSGAPHPVFFTSRPRIVAIRDINADNQQEVIVIQIISSGTICVGGASVIGWKDDAPADLLKGAGDEDLNCPVRVLAGDVDNDGIEEVWVVGYTAIHAPRRRLIDKYRWSTTGVYEFIPALSQNP